MVNTLLPLTEALLTTPVLEVASKVDAGVERHIAGGETDLTAGMSGAVVELHARRAGRC